MSELLLQIILQNHFFKPTFRFSNIMEGAMSVQLIILFPSNKFRYNPIAFFVSLPKNCSFALNKQFYVKNK